MVQGSARRRTRGSAARDRYMFADGSGPSGNKPPNNWKSIFGGSAWERVPDGQYYLHLFDAAQPDLNWRNPEVHDEMDAIVRLLARPRCRRAAHRRRARALQEERVSPTPPRHQLQDAGHAVLRPARGTRRLPTVAHDPRRVRRPDGDRRGLHRHAGADGQRTSGPTSSSRRSTSSGSRRRGRQPRSAESSRTPTPPSQPVDASPTWTLSNHDVTREVTRYGGGDTGLARSRAATLTMLAMPGSTYIYQGAELGLPEAFVPEKDRQDPVLHPKRHARPRRLPCAAAVVGHQAAVRVQPRRSQATAGCPSPASGPSSASRRSNGTRSRRCTSSAPRHRACGTRVFSDLEQHVRFAFGTLVSS